MDINTVPDRISTLILLLIAILGMIASYIPQIQSVVEQIPAELRFPAFIIAVIIVALVGVWSFYTSEKRSADAYNEGLYMPVPPPADELDKQ